MGPLLTALWRLLLSPLGDCGPLGVSHGWAGRGAWGQAGAPDSGWPYRSPASPPTPTPPAWLGRAAAPRPVPVWRMGTTGLAAPGGRARKRAEVLGGDCPRKRSARGIHLLVSPAPSRRPRHPGGAAEAHPDDLAVCRARAEPPQPCPAPGVLPSAYPSTATGVFCDSPARRGRSTPGAGADSTNTSPN